MPNDHIGLARFDVPLANDPIGLARFDMPLANDHEGMSKFDMRSVWTTATRRRSG